MNSPFTDFIAVASETLTANVPDFELKSPLLDHVEPYPAESINEEDENILMESELSAAELTRAVDLNRKYMIDYGWQKYAKDILRVLGITDDNWITNSAEENLKFFTNYFANWQDRQGYKTSQKGVFGLSTWTYFQKKIGLHNLSNAHAINVEKAIKGNRNNESKWRPSKKDIYEQLRAQGIITTTLPLNDEYFAYAIADFQALKGLKIDGQLGPITWASLKVIAPASTPSTSASISSTRSKWQDIITDTSLSIARPLVDGVETFSSIILDIRSAGEGDFIYILGWMLEIDFELIRGDKTTTLYELLKAAAGRKAEVRVLIWQNPFYATTLLNAKSRINALSTALADASMHIDNATVGSQSVRLALGTVHSLIKLIPFPFDKLLETSSTWTELVEYTKQPNETSHHEKIMIIKSGYNLTAYCGGVDINSNRLRNHYDTHCRLEGKAAWNLLQRFKQRWKAYTQKYVSISPTLKTSLRGESLSAPSDVQGPGIPHVKICHTYNGSITQRSIRENLHKVISNAERSVYMEDQYMSSCEIAGWLNERLRNVPDFKVTILTEADKFAKEDMRIPRRKRNEFVRKISWGIPNPENLEIKYVNYVKGAPIEIVHSKIYIVDEGYDGLAIVGSANCNRRSMINDSETAAFIFNDKGFGPSFVSDLKKKIYANHPKSNYDDYRYPTIPNTTKDLDTEIIETIDTIADKINTDSLGGSLLNVVIPGGTAISSFALTQAKNTVKAIMNPLWDVIDPNPNDEIKCQIPSGPQEEATSYADREITDVIAPFNEIEIPQSYLLSQPGEAPYNNESYNFYESGDEETETTSELFLSNIDGEDIDRQQSQELFNEFYIEPSKGVTDYLNVSAVRGQAYKTGVFIPASFSKSKSVDIVVYLHGMFDECDKTNGIASYWNSYSNIREYFYSAGKNALLIAPTLTKDPQNDRILLNHSGEFDIFLNACLQELKSKNYIQPDSDFNQIIIAAHSAGGKPLGMILSSSAKYLNNVTECWGFDCIYAEWWGKNMSNWAKGNKIFYHYWAWSCNAARLDRCPRVNGDKMQASNPSNFKNVPPVGKIHHQQVIEHAWLNEINTRTWFSAGGTTTTIPVPASTSAPVNSSVVEDMKAAYSKMNLTGCGLSFDAFRIACNGYRKLDQQGHLQNNGILSIADFTQSSKNRRLYILDMVNQKIIAQTKVAHGSKSVKPGDPPDRATQFSNTKGSNQSSLGFYVTQKTFEMRPHQNKRTNKIYPRGLSLYIEGKEGEFNSNARARAVVIHAAEYVVEGNDKYNGNSWGCPAIAYSVQNFVINTIKDGTCFFIYYNDPNYLGRSLLANDFTSTSQEFNFTADYTENEDYEEEAEAFNVPENETDPPPADIHPVPFAPLPPSGSYWPIRTSASEGRLVSYETDDGRIIGNPSRRFLANRTTSSGEPRNHVGIDLYGNFNDPVIACDDGKILSFQHFYTTKAGHDTNSLVVQHSNVIINYGEVGASSLSRLNLHVGDTVNAGQVIGVVGATGMLHFETYKIIDGTRDLPPHRWMKADSNPPPSLYNPTRYLLYLKQSGLTNTSGSTISSTTPSPVLVTGAPGQQWDNAIRLNHYYADKLGWNQFYEKINDLLLPYSGLKKVDLGEDVFAQAVSAWQRSQGFVAKDCDGIIGPTTWTRLRPLLSGASTVSTGSQVSSIPAKSIELAPQIFSSVQVPPGFRQSSYSGWHGLDKKSAMRVDEAAKLINASIPLKGYGITETDIDTFQRLANAETGGRIQNFYSLDMAIVSIGFRQFTFIHGNIHNWIEKAPAAFRRYGIEIDYTLPPYTIKRSKGNYIVKRLKGVDDPETLRWNGWAQRFYYAGLDYEIIIAEFLLAKEYFEKELGRLKSYLKNNMADFTKFTNYYNQSSHVRAFFHELNNAAPAYVPSVTAKALGRISMNEGTDRFLEIYLQTTKDNWPDPAQVQRIFDNTTAGATVQVFENELIYNEIVEEDSSSDKNELSFYEKGKEYGGLNSNDYKEPEIENFTLAQRIDMVRIWKDLLLYKVPDEIIDKLKKRSMYVQYAHDQSYSNDLNTDFYSVRILQYPTYNGVLLNAESLIRLIRLNMNSFVDTDYCDFNPYNTSIDTPVWESKNPVGAVLKLDIKGPDNASVVVSWSGTYGWQFSTIYAPDTGKHPVSGHREFYIINKPSDNGAPFFAIKGLDMMSTGIAGLGFPIGGAWGFAQADALWKSMISKVMNFINSNSGKAVKDAVYSERVEWRFVYRDYKYLLEKTFGKGAGSVENSPFFAFQLESSAHI